MELQKRELIPNFKIENIFFEELSQDTVESFFGMLPDLIILNSILHEVESLHNFMKTIRKFSNSGTSIFVNVPNSESLHLELFKSFQDKNLIDSNSAEISGRKRYFNISQLREIMQSYGFVEKECRTIGFKPFTKSQLSRIIDQRIVEGLNYETLASFEPKSNYGSEIEAIYSFDG
jgi:hypothetical protein